MKNIDKENNEPLPGAELSIVLPTFNEKENVVEVVERLDSCLREISWEVIFVDDDSTDGTSDIVRKDARQDIRIRCIQRISPRSFVCMY